jgi:hypothetical protein
VTKSEAKRRANLLVKKLKVIGTWKPVVSNNLGWHFKAILDGGSMSVTESHYSEDCPNQGYIATVSDTIGDCTTTHGEWASYDHQYGETPEKAVRAALNHAYGIVKGQLKVLETNLAKINVDNIII